MLETSINWTPDPNHCQRVFDGAPTALFQARLLISQDKVETWKNKKLPTIAKRTIIGR